MREKTTVYDVITNRIIQELETGVVPWRKTWNGKQSGMPKNLISERPYRGINVLLTWGQGYQDQRWVTFNQLQKIPGGKVIKGERSTPILFWSVKEVEDKETKEKKDIFSARYYNVFNVEQCELPPEFLDRPELPKVEPIEAGESIVKGYQNPPTILESPGGRAFYRSSTDMVKMPARAQFDKIEEFYATLFHELTHSTGHKSRLNRDGFYESHSFGDENYSKEELVAEMGAAMLCAHSGIENVTLKNSASYIQSWLNVLKADSKAVIHAASKAQKAVDHILGKTFKEEGGE